MISLDCPQFYAAVEQLAGCLPSFAGPGGVCTETPDMSLITCVLLTRTKLMLLVAALCVWGWLAGWLALRALGGCLTMDWPAKAGCL